MTRVMLVAIGSAVIAPLLCAPLGCGDKNDKPPLMPDQDHSDEAGAGPITPSTPAPATPPGK